jgi:Outer membrane protein beta-barrel domain
MKFISLLILLFCFASISYSDEPDHDLKLVIGTSAFLDEEIPFDHFVVGASMRFGLTKKLSVEPQFLYMSGPGSDRDYTLTGNISYNLLSTPRFSVYAVGGGGLIRHTQRFSDIDFSVNEWTVNGGLGVRLRLAERFFIAPEFRFGWEPLLSTQVGIGYSF